MTKNKDLTGESKLTAVDHVSEADIKRIDQALLSNASTQWSRIDRIVLTTMIELDNGMGLPSDYFVERMAHLVQDGALESKEGVTCTRSSEVRLKE